MADDDIHSRWSQAQTQAQKGGRAAGGSPGPAERNGPNVAAAGVPGGSSQPEAEGMRLALAAARLGTWWRHEPSGHSVWSAETFLLLGYEPFSIEPTYEAFLQRLHPADLAAQQDEFERAARERRDYETEYRVVWPNGELHWLQGRGRFTYDEGGNVERVFGVLIDIDRQKRTEGALREAHARLGTLADQLTSLAEATPGTLFTFRQPYEGKPAYLFVGPHLRETHGFSPEDLAADPLLLLKHAHPDDVEEFLRQTAEARRSRSMWHTQSRHLHPEKGEVWIEIFASPVADPEGLTWHGIALEITAHKRIEADLRAAHSRAEAADRAKSEFLANMSHEIRTPMSAILGYAEILSGRLQDAQDHQYLETMYRNGRYLLEIIDDILDLSRIEAGKIELHYDLVRPDELVLEVQALLGLRASEKGLELEVAFSGALPESVRTDRTRLRQILINLVENAIKFTERGRVRIVVQLLPDYSALRFDVTDTGIGIRGEVLETLFKPFTQADASLTRRFGGSGLGLSICRALSRKLGGEITVATREGVGSTFSLTLPTGDLGGVEIVEPQLGRGRSSVPPQTKRHPLGCTVLVVDDHADMRLLAKTVLEEAGAAVELAVDGEDALRAVAASVWSAKPFDVILLDIQMPRRDGYSTAAELRRDGYAGAIVAVTAHARKEDERRCLAAGCDEYVSKPLGREQLVEIVARYTQGPVRADVGTSGGTERGPRVLAVEDDEDALMLLAELLKAAGCSVRVGSDAATAMAAVKGAPVDIAILDLGLPDMSGAELRARLGAFAECSNTRFICLSGRNEQDVDWRGLGFDHFLCKPTSLEDLLALVRSGR